MSTSSEQLTRCAEFRDMHHGGGPLVLPNAWDAGSARILTALGFRALGTTSAGLAYGLGRADARARVGLGDALGNARAICGATTLPVTGDLESGYGDTPEQVADTIRLAASTGLAGASVEDATGDAEDPLFPVGEAAERVAAAVAAAAGLEQPFVVTARAENYLNGRPDLADTIRRLQAYERAGAHVLYAPALPDADAVRAVVSSVGVPVNVLGGTAAPGLSVAELADLGVRRISAGSALVRAALGAFERAAVEMRDHGTFGFLPEAMPLARANDLMDDGDPGGARP